MLVGYIAAFIMGAILGLIGGGGSILTVPILVYLFGIPAILATSYSLFIVGITSTIGVIKYWRNGLINFKAAVTFALPSTAGVILARKWILPMLPENSIVLGKAVTSDQMILIAFGLLVLVISGFMLTSRDKCDAVEPKKRHLNLLPIAAEGLVVGIATGFVGAGGGFMIVPALVLLAGIPMKEAIATSLLIICIKSLSGFASDISSGYDIDIMFLGILSTFTIAGAYFGSHICSKIPSTTLRKGFGTFVFLMGIFIIWKEF